MEYFKPGISLRRFWSRRSELVRVALNAMNSLLPPTGTAALLRELSPHVPDDFINQLLPRSRGRGRRRQFSPAQLWRLHQLALLSPVHSFNLLVQMLPEQKDWRSFAHLPNRQAIPDVWMLNQFRACMGVSGFRQINQHLLEPLLPKGTAGTVSVALIDATDLPASASGHKKSAPDAIRPSARPLVGARSRLAKAVSSWVTRSTRSGCGFSVMNAGSCWCPWSVGRLRPIREKVACWFQAWSIAGGAGSGGPILLWETWATSTPPANSACANVGT